VAVTPNGEYVYVTNKGSDTVSVIPTSSNMVTATVPVGTGPLGVAVSPNGDYAYVTNTFDGTASYGTVSVISTATNVVTATITIGYDPVSVAITPNGAYAYVTNLQSNSVSVISTGAPIVSVSPSLWTMDVGQSETFTAVASGGSGTYTSYQWYVDGVAQIGQTATMFNYSPAFAGTYSITAAVTDSSGTTSSQSYAATVTVNPIVSVSPSLWTMDLGQSQLFTAVASGGSGTYTSYQWYVNGASQSSATSSTFSFAPVSVGNYSITAAVTDSSGATSPQSAAASVTVYSALTPTPTPALTPIPTPTTPTTTATPSPTVPEFPTQLIGITLSVSMIVVLAVTVIAKKRRNEKSNAVSAYWHASLKR